MALLAVIAVAIAVLATAIVLAARAIVDEQAAARAEARHARELAIFELFAPGLAAAESDPRAFLVWQPLAKAARALMPDEFTAIDRAMGGTFPFSADRLQAAHAQWTADWLAWERTHDAEYKRRAAEAERDLAARPPGAARAELDAIEREKLDRYQRRYEEYIRTAKILRALAQS
jgi:hypothetical protein